MKAQEIEETDEEHYDDPIRLFDSDENAVYFGNQPHKECSTKNIEFRWQIEIPEELRHNQQEKSKFKIVVDELKQNSQSGSISECDLLNLSVKLVDCGKFPWYFRKYTQQILFKTNLNVNSDSDREIDVVGIDDGPSDDCFIVEEDAPDEIKKCKLEENKLDVFQTKHVSRVTMEKKLERIKHKEDIEIQIALSKKKSAKVDFKRNQGLVGMKIAQKNTNNVVRDGTHHKLIKITKAIKTNPKNVVPNEMYINAADKTLRHIGTELIPIIKPEVTYKPKLVDSINSINVPVSCNTDKRLINDVKDTNNSLLDANMKLDISNSVLKYPQNKIDNANKEEFKSHTSTLATRLYTSILGKSSSHVKDIKKTNKYKNSGMQNKIKTDNSLIGLLVSKPSKKETEEIKCTKNVEPSKIPHKNVEEHCDEPISPILQCSTVPKKRKFEHHIIPEFIKPNMNHNVTKERKNLDKIINKLANLSNRDDTQVPSKQVSSNTITREKTSDAYTKVVQKKSSLLLDKVKSKDKANRTQSLIVKNARNSCDLNKPNIKAMKNNAGPRPTSSNHNMNKFIKSNLASDTRHINVNKDLVNNVASSSLTGTHFVSSQPAFSCGINNKIIESNQASDARQYNLNTGSVNSIKFANLGSKTKASNGNAPTTMMVKPIKETNSAIASNPYASFPNSSSVPNDTSEYLARGREHFHDKKFNIEVQNRYASNIIFKPNQHVNFQAGNNYPELPIQNSCPQTHSNMHIPVSTPPRYQNHNLRSEHYKSALSGMYQNYSVNSDFPKQFPHPKDNNYQKPCSVTQSWYHVSLPSQNMAPPPPPPPLLHPSIPNNPTQSTYDPTQTTEYCLLVSQQQPSTSSQNNATIPRINDSSIIGENNGGLIKKINIVAVPVAKQQNVDTEVRVEVNDKNENTEVVASKAEMLKELDKLSFSDEDKKNIQLNDTNSKKKSSSFTKEILPKKRDSFEPKLTETQENYNVKIDQQKGYSPPILPIPTYEKVLDCIISDTQAQNQTSKSHVAEETKIKLKNLIKKRRPEKMYKKQNPAYIKPSDRKKNKDLKKISIEEYKKRLKVDVKPEQSNVKVSKKKYHCGGKRPYIRPWQLDYNNRKNVDYSTETDLGYDSDSTVVL